MVITAGDVPVPKNLNAMQREHQPPRSNNLKRSLPVVALLGLLCLLYFVPQLPPVRGWLLGQAVNAAQNAGYTLDYANDFGNPWTGLGVRGAEVRGPGVDVAVERLRLSYFLPGLFTGKLPFSVNVAGVTGDVTLDDVALPQSSSSGTSLPIRPVLRDLSLTDVAVGLNDVPYTLPDVTVSSLTAQTREDQVQAQAVLQTPDGQAEIDATVTQNPLTINADITQADLSVAQHWWDGVVGGTATGTATFENGEVSADLNVSDGAVSFLDAMVTDVGGTVTYQNNEVAADLEGRALGGTLNATGGVDVAAQQWFGDANGEVDLGDATRWLAAGRVPFDASLLPVSGDATVELSASGWQDVAVSGQAAGAGEVAGYNLRGLTSRLWFYRGGGDSSRHQRHPCRGRGHRATSTHRSRLRLYAKHR